MVVGCTGVNLLKSCSVTQGIPSTSAAAVWGASAVAEKSVNGTMDSSSAAATAIVKPRFFTLIPPYLDGTKPALANAGLPPLLLRNIASNHMENNGEKLIYFIKMFAICFIHL